MELFFKISSNIFVILFLIASLIILMIVLDKLDWLAAAKFHYFSDCVLVLVLLVLNNNLPIKDIYRAS